MPRSQFERDVIAAGKSFGWLVYHTHDSRRSEPGFPDVVMVRGSDSLFPEVKAGSDTTTDDQLKWLCALKRAGHEVCVVRDKPPPKSERAPLHGIPVLLWDDFLRRIGFRGV